MITEIQHKSPNLSNNKLAVFDFDWTLVCPEKSQKFSCNKDDWRFLYQNVKDVLNNYHQQGYTLIIVTYQTREYKIEMIHNVIKVIDIPIYVLIGDGDTKKDFILSDYLSNDKNLTNDKFYCGDADGSVGSWSDMDRVFAEKNGLVFYTPPEIFGWNTGSSLEDLKDVIIMCGSPGSGKSTFVREYIEPKGYRVVASDNYNSDKRKISKAIKILLKEGHKIVLDRCNPTQKDRQEWIDISDKSYTIIHMDVPKSIAIERVKTRTTQKSVPVIAINTWYKKFENTNIDIVVNTTHKSQ